MPGVEDWCGVGLLPTWTWTWTNWISGTLGCSVAPFQGAGCPAMARLSMAANLDLDLDLDVD
jgi:hypothetical protein